METVTANKAWEWTAEDDKLERVEFTAEMKKDYTILLPTMLPRHLKMIASLLNVYGYKAKMLENDGQEVIDTGLKYTHNDICYPALLVIGQFITALESGEYDLDKTALLFTQTGGGCRASNYISLVRKALKKAGYGHIPVISLNFVGLEKNSGFKLSLSMIRRMMYAVLYGDIMMYTINQTKPYEIEKGASEKLADEWTEKLVERLGNKKSLSYGEIKRTYRDIIKSFAALPMNKVKKERVGIVGEIYVKFSPLANRNLENYLIEEGAEPVVPGLYDFLLYCIYDGIIAKELGMKLKLDPMSFDACMAAVASGNADLAISGFSWTEERAEYYNISDWYEAGENETEQVLLIRAEDAAKYTKAEDFAGIIAAAN